MGKWHRKLCEGCLTPVQRLDQKYCCNCVVRIKPKNCVHNKPHSFQARHKIAAKKRKDKLTYSAVHTWLRREYGAANHCEIDGNHSGKFNWANISGKYLKDVNDYRQLCSLHHYWYDRDKKEAL
jgi:CRISPR/Cas system-associated endonuclease/helicase Cas3